MALEELEQVKSAEVSLQEQSAVVELNEDVADEVLKNAVEEFGYEVREIR
jgi:Heavy-metal-associated domain.